MFGRAIALLGIVSAGFCHGATDRELPSSNPSIFSYQPTYNVMDHASIDLDLKEIIGSTKKHTAAGFKAAMHVYERGAHSKSYASIKLDEPIPKNFHRAANVTGFTSSGTLITGKLLEPVVAGEDVLRVLYDDVIVERCQVGGSNKPVLRGCLVSSGKIILDNIDPINYTYDPLKGNHNARSLDKFSTDAEKDMWRCELCPHNEYAKFYEYYGKFDYANEWVSAAFDGYETGFKNGNADFSLIPREGRASAVQNGIAFMTLWMYVIREMEFAIDYCEEYCKDCSRSDLLAWDQAVALYTGSQQESGHGYLSYALANTMCSYYGTCGPAGTLTSDIAYVNLKVFEQFDEGQDNLVNKRCSDARKNKDRIVELMKVPLIQATIRGAHTLGVREDSEAVKVAETATFAAAVLPFVHACNPADANIIYQNLEIGGKVQKSSPPSFQNVRAAFERNYDCMGVTCDEIGGIIALNVKQKQYQFGAEPCGNRRDPIIKTTDAKADEETGTTSQIVHQNINNSKANALTAIFITVGMIALIMIGFILYQRVQAEQIEFTGRAFEEYDVKVAYPQAFGSSGPNMAPGGEEVLVDESQWGSDIFEEQQPNRVHL